MQYRRLGHAGLQVSELSLGSWVTYHNQVDTNLAKEMLAAAMDMGVNFFDNAEAYALGKSEQVMGDAIKALNWPRLNYIVSTKFFWGLSRGPHSANRKDTLNRKYLMQAIDGSLQRMGLDFIDLVYCHRPDPHTPLEETFYSCNGTLIASSAAMTSGASFGKTSSAFMLCSNCKSDDAPRITVLTRGFFAAQAIANCATLQSRLAAIC